MSKLEIKIYDSVEIDTLRHRETAQSVLQVVSESSETQVTLDFSGITFTSRSFMHELSSGLQDIQVGFVNANSEVSFMIEVAFKKPILHLKIGDKS